VLQRIRAEIDLSMALAGCATLADVTSDLIVR
jgi:isopentenyl diphosphate isomerase/L-lactate dehydrogenase-like FMN-dependent dehydrogenase